MASAPSEGKGARAVWGRCDRRELGEVDEELAQGRYGFVSGFDLRTSCQQDGHDRISLVGNRGGQGHVGAGREEGVFQDGLTAGVKGERLERQGSAQSSRGGQWSKAVLRRR